MTDKFILSLRPYFHVICEFTGLYTFFLFLFFAWVLIQADLHLQTFFDKNQSLAFNIASAGFMKAINMKKR
jgi:hypothetical protein